MTDDAVTVSGLEPVLIVNDLEETLQYYQQILGFTVDWTWPEEGKVDHASVSFGSSQGHNHEDDHDHDHIHIQLSQSDTTPVPNSGWIYIHISKGITELYQNMKDTGADLIADLQDHPWGMTEFDIRDLNGHRFRFGQPS